MKYFIDTEFHEYSKKRLFGKPIDTIELISIGIVADDGREYYAVSNEFNLKAAEKNIWLKENVLSILPNKHFNGSNIQEVKQWKSRKQIAKEIKYFVANVPIEQSEGTPEAAMQYNNPEFYAYYADYDWVVFCWLFGRMIDLPKGFPMYCRDLNQMMDEKELSQKWKSIHCPNPLGEHNALEDARWNLKLYRSIMNWGK